MFTPCRFGLGGGVLGGGGGGEFVCLHCLPHTHAKSPSGKVKDGTSRFLGSRVGGGGGGEFCLLLFPHTHGLFSVGIGSKMLSCLCFLVLFSDFVGQQVSLGLYAEAWTV